MSTPSQDRFQPGWAGCFQTDSDREVGRRDLPQARASCTACQLAARRLLYARPVIPVDPERILRTRWTPTATLPRCWRLDATPRLGRSFSDVSPRAATRGRPALLHARRSAYGRGAPDSPAYQAAPLAADPRTGFVDGSRYHAALWLSSAWGDKSGLVGADDGLGAVAGVELGENAGDVGLDGLVADDELSGDLGVREPLRDQAQHVGLAVG